MTTIERCTRMESYLNRRVTMFAGTMESGSPFNERYVRTETRSPFREQYRRGPSTKKYNSTVLAGQLCKDTRQSAARRTVLSSIPCSYAISSALSGSGKSPGHPTVCWL